MKRAIRIPLGVLAMSVLGGATSSLQAGTGMCKTGRGGPPPYCNEAQRTESCPTGPDCAQTIKVGGHTVTVVSLVGWVGWYQDANGDTTLVDCAGNWGTVKYIAGHATDQPTFFRVCGLGQTYTNCKEPAGFFDPCGNGSNLSNNNTYTFRNLSDFPCHIADDYAGLLDTDACSPYYQVPDLDDLGVSCDGPPYGAIGDDPYGTVTCSGS